MSVMTRNMNDLKDEVLTKIDKKLNDFNITIAEIRDQIKQEVSQKLLKEKLKKGKNWNPLFVSSGTCKKLSGTSK